MDIFEEIFSAQAPRKKEVVSGLQCIHDELICEGFTLSPMQVKNQKIVACGDGSLSILYRVTDDTMPNWSCYISERIYPDMSKKICLTAGDGLQAKMFEEEEWNDVLDTIFMMYHCLNK